MFTVTRTRIVGLIAAVCAVVVAPQALAGPQKSVKAAPKKTKKAAKTVEAAWSFPPCTFAQVEYEYVYSGDPCSK
jgi:hypothetical protein